MAQVNNNTGLNKFDAIGLVCSLVGLAAGIGVTIFGFKAGSERANTLASKCPEAYNQPTVTPIENPTTT